MNQKRSLRITGQMLSFSVLGRQQAWAGHVLGRYLAADAAVLGGFVLAGPVEQDFETFRPRWFKSNWDETIWYNMRHRSKPEVRGASKRGASKGSATAWISKKMLLEQSRIHFKSRDEWDFLACPSSVQAAIHVFGRIVAQATNWLFRSLRHWEELFFVYFPYFSITSPYWHQNTSQSKCNCREMPAWNSQGYCRSSQILWKP